MCKATLPKLHIEEQFYFRGSSTHPFQDTYVHNYTHSMYVQVHSECIIYVVQYSPKVG